MKSIEGKEYIPLCSNCDLSEAALRQAFIQLDFKLGNEYELHISKQYLEFIPSIIGHLGGVFKIKLVLEKNLKWDWWVQDMTNNKICYSEQT